MSNQGTSRAIAAGLTVTLLSVSVGIHHLGGVALLLCFAGVLAGATLVAVGVRMPDHPAHTVPVVFGGARALAAFLRRSTAVVGTVVASCASTAVSGEAEPMLCLAMFSLLLLGVTLVHAGARGE